MVIVGLSLEKKEYLIRFQIIYNTIKNEEHIVATKNILYSISCPISLDSSELRIVTGMERITITVTIKDHFLLYFLDNQLLMIIEHINNILEN